ncbi:hypothetical protein LXL04_016392 [Taraxacum kok-saghyz]
MAEPDLKPLPSDGSDSPNKRMQTDATGDPPNKRKKTNAAGDSPSSKHSDESSAANDVEIEDTDTSKKPKNDEIEIDNIEIMEAILAYQKREGVSLRDSPGDRGMFCFSYIKGGVGNGLKWVFKMDEMKTKFNSESAPMEDVEKKEFELWKKIWGDQQNDDDDPEPGNGSRCGLVNSIAKLSIARHVSEEGGAVWRARYSHSEVAIATTPLSLLSIHLI